MIMNITTLHLSDRSRLVLADGPRDHEGRVTYAWEVRAADMSVIARGDDLRSGCGAPVDHAGMQETFASFVGAWTEALDYPGSENADLFPAAMREWAEANDDELYLLTHDTEDDSMDERTSADLT